MKVAVRTSFLFLAATALTACSAAAQTSPSAALRVQVLSDLVTPVVAETVKISSPGTPSITTTTGPQGETPLFAVAPNELMSVVLEETALSDGIALGQQVQFLGPTSTAAGHWLNQVVTQPLALATTVTSDQSVTSGKHTRWTFSPVVKDDESAESVYHFAAHVAMLLTTAEIDAYKSYYGLTDTTFSGALGIVVRTDSVDVGSNNLSLQIDCRDHGFSATPGAKCFVVRRPPPGSPGAPTFTAEVIGWVDEQALLIVKGVLEKGDNIILLAPGSGTSSTPRLERADQDLVVPRPPKSSPQAGPHCTNPDDPPCVADSPSLGTPACTPSASSDDGCPAATPNGTTSCTTSSIGGDPFCGYQGSSTVASVTFTVGGSVSVGATFKVGGAQLGAGATGSVSTAVTMSASIATQNGLSGCPA